LLFLLVNVIGAFAGTAWLFFVVFMVEPESVIGWIGAILLWVVSSTFLAGQLILLLPKDKPPKKPPPAV